MWAFKQILTCVELQSRIKKVGMGRGGWGKGVSLRHPCKPLNKYIRHSCKRLNKYRSLIKGRGQLGAGVASNQINELNKCTAAPAPFLFGLHCAKTAAN
jgi:hypothetical protein